MVGAGLEAELVDRGHELAHLELVDTAREHGRYSASIIGSSKPASAGILQYFSNRFTIVKSLGPVLFDIAFTLLRFQLNYSIVPQFASSNSLKLS